LGSRREGWDGREEGDIQAAAVRIMSRAQWFLMSLPIVLSWVNGWLGVTEAGDQAWSVEGELVVADVNALSEEAWRQQQNREVE